MLRQATVHVDAELTLNSEIKRFSEIDNFADISTAIGYSPLKQ